MKRFWNKVKKTPTCWLWQGALNDKGYGVFHLDKKSIYAHRYSFFLKNKISPVKCILHKCDNPRCVNPKHLFEGTLSDNSQDMVKKGRDKGYFKIISTRGELNVNARINKKIALSIKKELSRGIKSVLIAKKFGVSKYIVSRIKRNITWNYVN